MIEIESRQSKAASAAERWSSQYCVGGKWKDIVCGPAKRIYDRLVSLGTTPTPEQVNEAIGNDSWTDTRCTECSKNGHEFVIRVGDAPDYESATAWLCPACLRKAFEIMTEYEKATYASGRYEK